jgi:hypothetical protein
MIIALHSYDKTKTLKNTKVHHPVRTAIITAKIRDRKTNEFYQTLESLKILIKDHCKEFETRISLNRDFMIKVTFEGKEELEKNFYGNEFNLLKGTIKSLCDNVAIIIRKTGSA